MRTPRTRERREYAGASGASLAWERFQAQAFAPNWNPRLSPLIPSGLILSGAVTLSQKRTDANDVLGAKTPIGVVTFSHRDRTMLELTKRLTRYRVGNRPIIAAVPSTLTQTRARTSLLARALLSYSH